MLLPRHAWRGAVPRRARGLAWRSARRGKRRRGREGAGGGQGQQWGLGFAGRLEEQLALRGRIGQRAKPGRRSRRKCAATRRRTQAGAASSMMASGLRVSARCSTSCTLPGAVCTMPNTCTSSSARQRERRRTAGVIAPRRAAHSLRGPCQQEGELLLMRCTLSCSLQRCSGSCGPPRTIGPPCHAPARAPLALHWPPATATMVPLHHRHSPTESVSCTVTGLSMASSPTRASPRPRRQGEASNATTA